MLSVEKELKTIFKFYMPTVIIMLTLLGNLASAGTKDPVIIQEYDYTTIEAIEALYSELVKTEEGNISFTISCETGKDSIILKQRGTSSNKVVIGVPAKGPVIIGRHSFRGQNVIRLFASLRELLADLSKQQECADVWYDQFGTRAYKKRTILEFDFGTQVVSLEAFSNGPKDDERLYGIYLQERSKSFFWFGEDRPCR